MSVSAHPYGGGVVRWLRLLALATGLAVVMPANRSNRRRLLSSDYLVILVHKRDVLCAVFGCRYEYTSEIDFLKRLVSKITSYLSCMMLNFAHSFRPDSA